MALSPSGHWHARLYCWTLYINCFFLGFRQWQSPADRVSTLIMNIWLPLPVFWSPWSRTDSDQGPDTATWVGLAHGCDYSYCRASAQKLRLVLVFPWIVENTWKQGPSVRVFQPSSPRLTWRAKIPVRHDSQSVQAAWLGVNMLITQWLNPGLLGAAKPLYYD